MLREVVFSGQGETQKTTYAYDESDGLKKRTSSDGTFVAYDYHKDGALASVTTNFGETGYAYNALGRLAKVTGHNGDVGKSHIMISD